MYYVPGSRGKSFEEFDLFGNLVVESADFRVFESQDGTYPLGFRSDTRKPSEIFQDGFSPKQYGRELHKKSSNENAPQEHAAAIRLGKMDADPEISVSLSLDFNITALFPYDPKKPQTTMRQSQIYICALRSWLEVYRVQEVFAKHLAYSKEVASLGVPAEHVLGVAQVQSVPNSKKTGLDLTIVKREFNMAVKTDILDRLEMWNIALQKIPTKGSVLYPKQNTEKQKLAAKELADRVGKVVTTLQGNNVPSFWRSSLRSAPSLNGVTKCEYSEIDLREVIKSFSQKKTFNEW